MLRMSIPRLVGPSVGGAARTGLDASSSNASSTHPKKR
jgi:hypothetical protein